MKTSLILTIALFTILGTALTAQTRAFTVGIVYGNNSRQDLDNYIDYFTNAVGLPSMPITNSYGVGAAFSTRTKNTEAIFGCSLAKGGFNKKLSSDKSRSLLLKQSNFNFNLGVDQYIVPWFFVGGQFLVTNFSGTAKYENTGDPIPADTLIETTGDHSNIFLGYGVGVRGESGFFIPLKKEGSGIKILGYYDLGLSKFNFYDSFDKVITSYSGNKKTKGNTFGVHLLFSIPLGDN